MNAYDLAADQVLMIQIKEENDRALAEDDAKFKRYLQANDTQWELDMMFNDEPYMHQGNYRIERGEK